MGDIRRVIPADSAMKQQFQFGDPVYQVTVVKVEEDGTLVLQADGLELEDDNAAPGDWIEDNQCEEGIAKQFYGEKIRSILLSSQAPSDYVGKIVGMILDGHDVEQLKHLVRDPNELKHLGKAAYEILCKDKWQPQGVESWPKAEHPRKLYEEDLVSVVLRATKYNVETASRLSRRYWTPRGAARLASLVGEYKAFYGGSCCAFQELMESEGRNVAEYLDLDQVRAVHGGPQSSYHKCKFWEKGNCRNGDHCRFEHRLCGQDWINPSSSSSEVRRKDPLPVSDKQQDAQNDGDIGEPPTDEGDVDEDQQAREDAAFQEQHQYGKGTGKGSTKGSFAGRSKPMCSGSLEGVWTMIPDNSSERLG
ncbi:unnamed protein product [Symbiodinium natans]|uniref:C3H1-type domain-containing protein n=1 Tax=Symbiodinium natans TaxID=878477 RepID=A0A812PSK9_9DINO|nr:unnamed protein product [Symbiodinium natans]